VSNEHLTATPWWVYKQCHPEKSGRPGPSVGRRAPPRQRHPRGLKTGTRGSRLAPHNGEESRLGKTHTDVVGTNPATGRLVNRPSGAGLRPPPSLRLLSASASGRCQPARVELTR
jgi:hypothetical protein